MSLTRVFICTGTLSDYQFMRRHTGSAKRAEKAKEAWGTSLNSLQDVYRVFTKYTSGMHAMPTASSQTGHWHNSAAGAFPHELVACSSSQIG